MQTFCWKGGSPSQKLVDEDDPLVLKYNEMVNKEVLRIKEMFTSRDTPMDVLGEPIPLAQLTFGKDSNNEHDIPENDFNEFAQDVINQLMIDRDVLRKMTHNTELYMELLPKEEGKTDAVGVIGIRIALFKEISLKDPLDDKKKRCVIL